MGDGNCAYGFEYHVTLPHGISAESAVSRMRFMLGRSLKTCSVVYLVNGSKSPRFKFHARIATSQFVFRNAFRPSRHCPPYPVGRPGAFPQLKRILISLVEKSSSWGIDAGNVCRHPTDNKEEMDVAASVPKLYGGAYYTDSGIFNFLFDPSNLVLVLGFVIGIQILIALIANYKGSTLGSNPTTLYQRAAAPASSAASSAAAPARPVVPVVNPQAAKPQLQAPKVVPVAQKKTQPELVKPTLQTKSVEITEEMKEVKKEEKKGMDATYEAYRNAMLGSGPRQQMESLKLETKTGSIPPAFRQSVANLKLPNEDTAAFLARTNVSVNDRMVAILDAVQA